MKRPKMPVLGHYRPPQTRLPGQAAYNAPGVGRVGKSMPSPKILTPKPRKRR